LVNGRRRAEKIKLIKTLNELLWLNGKMVGVRIYLYEQIGTL
jgi:hypothetical protein